MQKPDDQERPNQDGSVTKGETGCQVCEGTVFQMGACRCRGPEVVPGPVRSPGPWLNGSGRRRVRGEDVGSFGRAAGVDVVSDPE